MKKVTFAVVVLVLVRASVLGGTYSGGTGEANDPYRIATAEDLNDIGNHVEDFNKCFVMVNDINLSGYSGSEFNIIGVLIGPGDPNNAAFSGIFDGNDHTIMRFSYTKLAGRYVGLFRYLGKGGRISDLGIVDANVAGQRFVGVLAGQSDGHILNCHVRGEVGGLESEVGGLVGGMGKDAALVHCWAKCDVRGEDFAGGLVGICGTPQSGGLVVWCDANGTVEGNRGTGGLVGGVNGGSISNSYAACKVDGNDWTGGLIGGTRLGTVLHCYSSGQVSGNLQTGGLVGHEQVIGGDTYVSCFWDNDVSSDVNGIGNANEPNVVGKTTGEMMTESTFTDAGWDFVGVWNIGEGQTYPFLREYGAGDLNHDGIVNMLDFAILADDWLDGAE